MRGKQAVRWSTIAIVLISALVVIASPTAAQAEPRPAAVRVAIAGDSNSALILPDTWPHHVIGERVKYVGGWTLPGATSTMIAENVRPVRADVLIVMAGTNDFHTQIGVAQNIADLDRIAATIRAPRVIVLALPPIDYIASTGLVNERNAAFAEASVARGWEYIDPWASLRTPEGTWVPGASADGIHALATGYAIAGDVIQATIHQSGSQS